MMDLLCQVNLSEPVRIYAAGGEFTHPGLDSGGNLVATIRFESGPVASLAQGG